MGTEFWPHEDRYLRVASGEVPGQLQNKEAIDEEQLGKEVTEDEDGEAVEVRVAAAMEHASKGLTRTRLPRVKPCYRQPSSGAGM